MLERFTEMFAKVLKVHISLSRTSINGTYHKFAFVLENKHGSTFKFPVSVKSIRTIESKLNLELIESQKVGSGQNLKDHPNYSQLRCEGTVGMALEGKPRKDVPLILLLSK